MENHKKYSIFPGWIMVILAMLCLTFIGNFMVQATTTANAFMMKNEATAINRTLYGLAFTVAALCKGFPQPLVGALQDKKGSVFVFRIGAIVAILVGLVFARFANSSGIAFVLIFGIGSGVIYMCASMIPCAGIVNAWFVKKRGPAQSIIQVGTVFAGVVAPKVVNYVTKLPGAPWYWGYYVFGFSSILALILTFFIKENPQMLGLEPDGELSEKDLSKLEKQKQKKVNVYVRDLQNLDPIDYKTALKTPVFWLIAIAIVAGTYGNNVLQSPGPLHFYDYGWSTDIVTTAMAMRQLVRVVVIVGLFKLTVKIEPIRLMGILLVLNAVTLAWCSHPTSVATIFLFYFVGTATITGYLVVGPVAMANYFGKKDSGKIIGFMLLLTGVIGSFGSTISGVCYDMTGSYAMSFYFFTGVSAVGALCAFLVKFPQNKKVSGEKSASIQA